MSKTKAKEAVKKFKAGKGKGAFTNISRSDVARSLLTRIDKPGLINQGGASLCGPAALVYNLATRDPLKYVNFVISLFENGRGTIGKLQVKAGNDLRSYTPPKNNMDPADWIALASIRDSENWFFDYQAVQDTAAGITMPGTLKDWYKKAGYKKVVDETNVYFNKDETNLRKASNLHKKGWKISLFINTDMLYKKTQSDASTFPNHWVVLTSPITASAKSVSFKIYTWGNPNRSVPQTGTLSMRDFLDNYYGFVGCKY